MRRPNHAALPAGRAAIREAQAMLRRQSGPVMERAVNLLDRIAADMALNVDVLARCGLPREARRCATPIAETARLAVEPPPASHRQPDRTAGPVRAAGLNPPVGPVNAGGPAPGPAVRSVADASLEAFLAAQRQRIARSPGVRGSWGGAHGGGKRGAQ